MANAGDIIRAGDNFGEWISFTPTLLNVTVGSSTLLGMYRRTGEFCIELVINVVFMSATINGPIGFVLPAGLQGDGTSAGTQIVQARAYDSNVLTGYAGHAKLQGGGGANFDRCYGPSSIAWNASTPFSWAQNDELTFQGFVRVTT